MAHLPWLRLYVGIVDNAKLRLLPKIYRWYYVAILCLEQEGLLNSSSNLLTRKIAVKLEVEVSELIDIKQKLIEVELIDDDWHPIGWNERQFKSDSSTERTRKYRENKKKKKQCDGNETSQEHHGDALDTDTKIEVETKTDTQLKADKSNSPEFENAMNCYPPRAGGNPKGRAWKAWQARLKSNCTAAEMTEGVKRYFDFCQATGKIGTEFVKQAATFFGPDEHFKELWTIPVAANKQEALENRNRAIANEWARGGSNA